MDGTSEEQTDGIGATEAMGKLELAASGEPFFLALGFYRPHSIRGPKAVFAQYNPEHIEIPETPEGYLEALQARAKSIVANKIQPISKQNLRKKSRRLTTTCFCR